MNIDNLIEVSCPNCGSWEKVTIVTTPDFEIKEPTQFTVVRCLNCSFIYTSRRPDYKTLFSKYYPDDYLCYGQTKEGLGMRIDKIRRQRQAVQRIKQISPFLSRVSSPKVLDVGCATGDFIKTVKRQFGWEANGLEPNKNLSRQLEQDDITIFPTTLEEVQLPSNSYDLITLFNVFEHVWDPIVALNKLNDLLKVHGLLVLEIPNFKSLSRRIFGRYWFLYHLPRHLSHFSRETITPIMAEAGFKPLKFIYQFRPTINAISLKYFSKDKFKSKLIKNFFSENNPLILFLSIIYELSHNIFSQANTMTVVFQKTENKPPISSHIKIKKL